MANNEITNYMNTKPVDILLVRVKFDNDRKNCSMAMSKPCTNCLEWLKIYQIRNIYYTNHTGDLICESAKEMLTDHQSKKVKFNIKPKANKK
jgi:tRNA(Arg) A34 adenosine deaminase TadA